MNYNALISRLQGLDATDLLKTEQIAAVISHINDPDSLNRVALLLKDLNDPDTIQTLNAIQDLDMIVQNINALNNTTVQHGDIYTQRERFVERVRRLAECEGKIIPIKSGGTAAPPQPYTSRFDFVYVDFGGVGWEYDGPHYAMIWNDEHNDSEVTVIPTTSKYVRDFYHEFSIGQIQGLPPVNTILSVRKKMMVSRKRFIPKRSSNEYVYGKVHPRYKAWVRDKVEGAIAIDNFTNVRPLEHYVRYQTRSALPNDLLTHYPPQRFKPVLDVSYDPATLVLSYREWNKSNMETMQFINPTSQTWVSAEYKRHGIYDPMFSSNASDQTAAITEFQMRYLGLNSV